MDDVLDESVSEEDLRVGTTVNCQFDNVLMKFGKSFDRNSKGAITTV
jgi:hypothetical protein